jgi:hypothetical protein
MVERVQKMRFHKSHSIIFSFQVLIEMFVLHVFKLKVRNKFT